jgi:ABC-type amino acid transport substrate-binding protein
MKKLFFNTLFLLVFLNGSIFPEIIENGERYKSITTNKILKVGISKHYPPLNFKSGSRGLEINMAKKLGKFLNVKVKFIPLPVSEYINALKTNKVDILISGLSRNLKRANFLWFSTPYITITPAVLVRKNILPQTKFGDEFEKAPIKTLWNLRQSSRFKLAVKKGSSYIQILNDKFPSMKQIIVKTNKEGLNKLLKGRVDGFIHDSLFLDYMYRNNIKLRNKYKLLQGGNLVEKICIGLPFGDSILKNQIDLFILEIIRQGYIDEWLKNYRK